MASSVQEKALLQTVSSGEKCPYIGTTAICGNLLPYMDTYIDFIGKHIAYITKDQFSLQLNDEIAKADDELDIAKRKAYSGIIANSASALGTTSLLVSKGVYLGADLPSLIPTLVGTLPTVHAAKSIIDIIKNYFVERAAIKITPAFILGTQK